METGYLLSGALWGLVLACALRPPRRHGRLGLVAYLAGMVVNELPVIAVYGLLVPTVSAVLDGHLGTPSGLVALGLVLLDLVGVGVLVARALPAGAVLDSALADGLGAGWRDHLEPEVATVLRTRTPVLVPLLLPFRRRRRDVERIPDLSYGPAGKRNLLDVYRPRAGGSGLPVFVHFHGGHFQMGHKDSQSLPLLHQLASHGWLCVSANYRLAPATFPDHLVDAKRVLAWVRAHGADHGADPSVIVVAGDSAGAHLAASAALTADDPAYQPGFEDADCSVSAAVCLYGYYGRTTADPASSPAAHVRPDAPPFLVVHGDRDSVALVDRARAFVTPLAAVSRQPVVYAELPGAQHGFDYFHSIRTDAAADRIEAFCAWVRSGRAVDERRSGPRGGMAP